MLPYVSYKELTGDEPVYRENNEIISNAGLLELNRAGMLYTIFSGEDDDISDGTSKTFTEEEEILEV